jgi:hypothetical protein
MTQMAHTMSGKGSATTHSPWCSRVVSVDSAADLSRC